MSSSPILEPQYQDLANAVHQLSQQLNSLAAENQQFRHLLQTQASTTRSNEPKVMLPEKFSGRHSELRNFLAAIRNLFDLQPSRYESARAKTGLIGSLCVGDALSWYRTIQETNSALLQDWTNFVQDMQDHFGDPYVVETSRRQLLSLNQGKSSASTFAARFRRVAADAGFNDETLQYHFERGLNPEVKRAIAINNQSFDTLDDLLKYSIRVDNRLFEAQRSDSVVPRPFATPAPPGPTPMEIGSVAKDSPRSRKLSDEEKIDRRTKGLCLYCGQPGHLALTCPAKQHLRVAGAEVSKND